MSEIYGITEGIFRLQPAKGVFSSEALALMAYQERSGVEPTLGQQEYASKYRRRIYNSLLERNDWIIRQGGLPTFESVSSPQLQLRWVPSSKEKPRTAEWLRLRSVVARWLDDLDDSEYERAAGLLMRLLGAERVLVTPHGNEYGIDFLAIMPAYCSNPLFISGTKGMRVVGQCKKYSSSVQRDKIQSFNALMVSIRENKEELTTVIPGWFRGSSSPFISCFVAHSGFQEGGVRMAGQHGHIMLDTLQMAEIIARSKAIRFGADPTSIVKSLWTRLQSFEHDDSAVTK